VVSRRWLSTVVSAEETSTQIEVAFTAALTEEGWLSGSTLGCWPGYAPGRPAPPTWTDPTQTASRC